MSLSFCKHGTWVRRADQQAAFSKEEKALKCEHLNIRCTTSLRAFAPTVPFAQTILPLDGLMTFFLISYKFLLKFQLLIEVFFEHHINNDKYLLPTFHNLLPCIFFHSMAKDRERNCERAGGGVSSLIFNRDD